MIALYNRTVEKELDAARQLALDAGEILLAYYASPPEVEWKAPGDPVTQADREASDLIVSRLRELFPSDGILCEEEPDDERRLACSRVWMVDPMDGTREFIAHRDEFAVMIGLAVDAVPVVGAVYQPTSGKLYYAAAGHGAFLKQAGNTRALHVSGESEPSRMTIAVSRSHRSSRVARIRERMHIPHEIQTGSVGLKTGLICEGLAHVYIHAGSNTNLWDTCGPEAILREAGGRVTDVSNAPLQYDQPEVRNLNGLVASNGVVHERFAKVTRSVL
jgi:3'(2'), 5'-bisphosphate nucleotidase